MGDKDSHLKLPREPQGTRDLMQDQVPDSPRSSGWGCSCGSPGSKRCLGGVNSLDLFPFGPGPDASGEVAIDGRLRANPDTGVAVFGVHEIETSEAFPRRLQLHQAASTSFLFKVSWMRPSGLRGLRNSDRRLAPEARKRMDKGLNAAWICLYLSTLLTGLSHSAIAQSPRSAVLAAGTEDGIYTVLGHSLSDLLAKGGISLQVLSTGGSVENIELLESGRAQFAVVQSDVASAAIVGGFPFVRTASHLRLVSSVYTEAVHVFARSGLYIPTSNQLNGKIISLGPPGSGTAETARVVLEASGISLREVDAQYLQFAKMEEGLSAQSLDAAFLVGPVPFPPVQSALRHQNARLVPLESHLIDRLVKQAGYVETVIPRLTYPGQFDEVPTIGVRALLLARDDADEAVVAALGRILNEKQGDIEHKVGIRLDPSVLSTAAHVSIPLHSTVRLGVASRVLPWLDQVVVLLLIAAMIVALFLKRHHASLLLASNAVVARVIFIPLAILGLGSLGMYYFERHVNEHFSTLFGSAWSIVVYISGGFQSRAPLTRGGETVATLIVVLGVALAGWVTAELAAHLLKREIGKVLQYITGRRLMPGSIQDHIIIFNWDHRAAAIIRQLHGEDFAVRLPIVVMSGTKFELPSDPEFERVIPHIGEINEALLRRACVNKARSITILSTWNFTDHDGMRMHMEPDVADSRTVMLMLLVRGLSAAPITAEIIASKNVPAARFAGQGGPLEVVCAEKYTTDFLAQCAFTPGIAAVYEDLLTFGLNSNEIYKVQVPSQLQGKSFAEVLERFTGVRRQTKDPIIPIGVCRASSVHLNPIEEEIGALLPGDEIIVISDHQPKL